MADDIKVSFVIRKDCKNENECSEDMQLAYVTCEGHRGGGLQPRWVKETELTQFEGLTKRDVFVLNEFGGEIFDKLRATKCLLVGPRCLSCCLTEGTPIPSGPEPVFTVAMKGLVVTASGLTKQKKETIKRKVQWMGGLYTSALTDEATHVVSDTVLSDKYIKAVEKNIPVMSESWIQAVWEMSLHLNINGSSPDFMEHRLPPFTNLQVTTSGISKKDKQMIVKLVTEGGGTFSGAFQSETTDVVVLTREGVGSEKYKAALEYGKVCVLPSWVKDSAMKGIALPPAKYKVIGASTSSPLTEHRLPDMSLNFSRITNLRAPSNFVDETRAADVSSMSGRVKMSQDTKKSSDAVDKDVQDAFENFDMSIIKKARPIFDGFCIWLCGPAGAWRERASACISRGGAVRYDTSDSRVTHVLAGSAHSAAAAVRHLPHVPVLTARWLIDSLEAGRPLDETQYLIDAKPSSPVPSKKSTAEPASPMSKRNLQLLRRGPLTLPPPEPEPEAELTPSSDLVNHYLSQAAPEADPDPAHSGSNLSSRAPDAAEVTDDVDEPTEEVEQIFRDIKIEVQGLEEEAICEIGAEISASGGCLVAAGAGGTHVLVPLDFDTEELITKDAVPLTVFWVKDCLSQQELVPIQYYHRPVKVPEWGPAGAPLTGVVASLSTYCGVERAFLDELAKLLGATTQLRFCRRTTSSSLASTHLICPHASGDKYQGAVKWGLPAVTGHWLLECARRAHRVPEAPYLLSGAVDTSTAPAPAPVPKLIPAELQEISEQDVQSDRQDKENAMLPPALGTVAPRRGSIPSREHTPRAKQLANEGESELSPASRYIAMARQGLLGSDTQETPKRVGQLKDDARNDGEVRTPPLEDALSTPNLMGLSPTTRRRLQAVKRGEMPSDPIKTPVDPFDKNRIMTPDSEFGAALRPGSGRLSPDARKRLWNIVQDLPTKEPQTIKEKQTPLSEIRNRFLAQFNGDASTPPSEHQVAPRKLNLKEHEDTPPAKMARLSVDQSPGTSSVSSRIETNIKTPLRQTESSLKTPLKPSESSTKSASESSALPAAVDAQLQRLSAALSGRNSTPSHRQRRRDSVKPPSLPAPESEPGPESQPNTVGWDDTTPKDNLTPIQPPVKRFMLSSNVDNREELVSMIEQLGGSVSEGTELDPLATHLLCAAPGRSEKMLGSVAHGKWVLHPAYVARSRAAGAFVQEEDYEWGNDRATCLPAVSPSELVLARAAHRWRHSRAHGQPGPFCDVVALLHVPPARRRLLARLIVAGDGQAPDIEPPYNHDGITVCFADLKRYALSERDAAWLKSRRIPVCAPVVLSSYLTEEVKPNPVEHCLPDFRT